MPDARKSNHRIVFWVSLSTLLLLRIPLASWIHYLFPVTSAWIEPLYEIGTYLLTVFLIWLERENLEVYHIDGLALVMVVFFKPFSILLLPLFGSQDNPIAFPKILSFSFIVIAAILTALIFHNKIALRIKPRSTLLWFFFGSIAGMVLFVLYGIIMIRWLEYPVPSNPGRLALLAPLYQLGYAAVAEEPLFRGFLWGGLKHTGLKECWILLIQAILFTAAHIHLLYTAQPVLFLGLTFINAIIFGLFVWRSRLLSSSMALHGFANGAVSVQYWIHSFLFR